SPAATRRGTCGTSAATILGRKATEAGRGSSPAPRRGRGGATLSAAGSGARRLLRRGGAALGALGPCRLARGGGTRGGGALGCRALGLLRQGLARHGAVGLALQRRLHGA